MAQFTSNSVSASFTVTASSKHITAVAASASSDMGISIGAGEASVSMTSATVSAPSDVSVRGRWVASGINVRGVGDAVSSCSAAPFPASAGCGHCRLIAW